MSWLYTIIFAGLVASSQPDAVKYAQTAVPTDTVAAHSMVVDETEKFEQTYPLNENGRVNVSNINGSITVEAWDQNSVKLEYTKIADNRDRLKDVEVRINSRADSFSVETEYSRTDWNRDNGRDRGKLSVDFRLMVPKGAILDEIETVNGSVAVSNFNNYTKVSAVNGTVTATNCRGNARLSTVNGEVNADFDSLDAASKISLDTVNGRVNLTIPSDANVTLRADSLNGKITNAFGLPVRKGKYVGRDMFGRLGSGAVDIRLNSVNGELTVSRKNDGKTPAPATDLLPQKGRDDDDWDDTDSTLRSARMEKDIARAMRDSSKAAARAAAEQRRVMAPNPPAELPQIAAEAAVVAAKAGVEAAKALQSKDFQRQLESVVSMRAAELARFPDIGFRGSSPRVEAKSNTLTVKGIPTVTVLAKDCSVTIHGWDKNEVKYRVSQVSDARNNEPLGINEDHTDTGVTIKVVNPNSTRDRGGFFRDINRTRVEVYVPRKSNLKIDANGEIRLENVSGEIDLSGADESINVRDADGKLRLESAGGRIRVIGFRGDVEATSGDGMISLDGDFTKLNASSNEGEIVLTVPDNASADISVDRGTIRSEGIAMTSRGEEADRTKFTIGKGGALFAIGTDGGIRLRAASSLFSFN